MKLPLFAGNVVNLENLKKNRNNVGKVRDKHGC